MSLKELSHCQFWTKYSFPTSMCFSLFLKVTPKHCSTRSTPPGSVSPGLPLDPPGPRPPGSLCFGPAAAGGAAPSRGAVFVRPTRGPSTGAHVSCRVARDQVRSLRPPELPCVHTGSKRGVAVLHVIICHLSVGQQVLLFSEYGRHATSTGSRA